MDACDRILDHGRRQRRSAEKEKAGPKRPGLRTRYRQLSAFQEWLESARPAWVPQLPQRLRFDLPDALAGDREALTDFFERVLGALADAEAHLDDALFTRCQRLEDVVGLFLEVQVDDGFRRRHDVRVGDEV